MMPCCSLVRFAPTFSKNIAGYFDVCLPVHHCKGVEKKNQLDATEWCIALIICSTCLGHLHAHHQERKTILVLLLNMVCYAVRVKRYN